MCTGIGSYHPDVLLRADQLLRKVMSGRAAWLWLHVSAGHYMHSFRGRTQRGGGLHARLAGGSAGASMRKHLTQICGAVCSAGPVAAGGADQPAAAAL